MSAVPTTLHRTCPTFVVAKSALDVEATPTIFRSYPGKDVRPSKCAIWQAARATTAAPSFFKEMFIDNPRPGISYVDGGLGYNNPSEVSLDEAAELWPTSKHFCLVSIGTGRSRAVQIVDTQRRNVEDIETQRTIFQQLRSSIPELENWVPGWKKVENFRPGVVAILGMANALSRLVTSSEEANERLLQASETKGNPFPYFRFNVERDIGDIGLEDWKKEEAIATLTSSYLRQRETKTKVVACVRYLINPPEFNRIEPN